VVWGDSVLFDVVEEGSEAGEFVGWADAVAEWVVGGDGGAGGAGSGVAGDEVLAVVGGGEESAEGFAAAAFWSGAGA
jgi:hypothetical protein